MKKLWFTAAEIAELKLHGLPSSKRAINDLAGRSGWNETLKCRERVARGGGKEYHITLLPQEAQNAIALRALKNDSLVLEAPKVAVQEPVKATTKRGGLRRDAKLTILMVWDAFKADSKDPIDVVQFSFCTLYKSRKIKSVPEWVYEEVESFSVSTLKNWLKARSKGSVNSLAGNYGNRKGTSLLETAYDGKVVKLVISLMINQPHLTSGHIRDLIRAEFTEPWEVEIKGVKALKEIPNIRSIQRFMKTWKNENGEVFTRISDPDKWKNKYMVAPGKANAWVTAPNQLWEIDASPVDALCVDGRYNLYCVIDIYTRRMKILVSKTPTTAAALLLIRKAIMDWGVPDIIRTDNGSDFVSHAFVRALVHLGIKQDIAAPFTPEHKGTVERAIGTFQRGCMPLMPGFIGHDVTDRKKIEARKSFAQRLGEKEHAAFTVELTHLEVQDYADQWVENKYHHNPHGGLNGDTPYNMATVWTGPVKRIENEQSLHIMLAQIPGKEGNRVVTKKGISLDGITYWHHDMQVGQRLHVRYDPEDMGRVHCFSEDHEDFLFSAINTEYEGLNREAMAEMAKRTQRERLKQQTADIRRDVKKFKPRDAADAYMKQAQEDAMNASNLVSFPRKDDTYSTPALDAASDAAFQPTLDMPKAPQNMAELYEEALINKEKLESRKEMIRPVDKPAERYARARKLQNEIQAGLDIDEADRKWLEGYLDTSEYRARAKMEEHYGEGVFQMK
jgi:transposase InsO family protein